jgi:GNAT superfamily N-acetyltransferase
MTSLLPDNITITDEHTDGDYTLICDNLYKYNVERTEGPRIDISFVMKDSEKIIGGCFCNTFSKCLYVDVMWLDEAYRGRGYGKLMIDRAENTGKENGCVFSHTCTFGYQAPEFYIACGYEIFAELHDYPDDVVQYFLKKKL